MHNEKYEGMWHTQEKSDIDEEKNCQTKGALLCMIRWWDYFSILLAFRLDPRVRHA